MTPIYEGQIVLRVPVFFHLSFHFGYHFAKMRKAQCHQCVINVEKKNKNWWIGVRLVYTTLILCEFVNGFEYPLLS